MRKGGVFCETYGINARNLVLENLLENQELDFAVGDVAKQTKVSRPKAYEIIKELEKKGLVKKSRIIGKTQLYILNKADSRVKLFIKDFKECLRLAYGQKSRSTTSSIVSTNAGMAYAKPE